MRRLGLFGGTFDPVHRGHLEPAAHAFDALGLDALVLIPGGRPPHKLGEPLSRFCHRYAMLALATQGRERWYVSDVELERQGPTYTIDTLEAMRTRLPAEETFFLMGSDSFAQLPTWHRWEELLEATHLVVLHRAGAWGEELVVGLPRPVADRVVPLGASARLDAVPAGPRIFVLEHEPVSVSATELRRKLRMGEPLGDELLPEVQRYARKYHLYDRHEGDARDDGQ